MWGGHRAGDRKLTNQPIKKAQSQETQSFQAIPPETDSKDSMHGIDGSHLGNAFK
jgi:hypothetical protein